MLRGIPYELDRLSNRFGKTIKSDGEVTHKSHEIDQADDSIFSKKNNVLYSTQTWVVIIFVMALGTLVISIYNTITAGQGPAGKAGTQGRAGGEGLLGEPGSIGLIGSLGPLFNPHGRLILDPALYNGLAATQLQVAAASETFQLISPPLSWITDTTSNFEFNNPAAGELEYQGTPNGLFRVTFTGKASCDTPTTLRVGFSINGLKPEGTQTGSPTPDPAPSKKKKYHASTNILPADVHPWPLAQNILTEAVLTLSKGDKVTPVFAVPFPAPNIHWIQGSFSVRGIKVV